MDNTELEDLEQLVSLPGWRRFVAGVSIDDESFSNDIAAILGSAPQDEQLAAIRGANESRMALATAVRWPHERIHYLRRLLEGGIAKKAGARG